jgi:hypothetical protein
LCEKRYQLAHTQLTYACPIRAPVSCLLRASASSICPAERTRLGSEPAPIGAAVRSTLRVQSASSGTTSDRQLPVPWLPEGLRLSRSEGAGQTQTPLLGATADGLALGDDDFDLKMVSCCSKSA